MVTWNHGRRQRMISDYENDLMYIKVHEIRHDVPTEYGNKTVVVFDYSVLEGEHAGTTGSNAFVFWTNVIESLKKYVGGPPVTGTFVSRTEGGKRVWTFVEEGHGFPSTHHIKGSGYPLHATGSRDRYTDEYGNVLTLDSESVESEEPFGGFVQEILDRFTRQGRNPQLRVSVDTDMEKIIAEFSLRNPWKFWNGVGVTYEDAMKNLRHSLRHKDE